MRQAVTVSFGKNKKSWTKSPTEYLTISEPSNPSIDEFFLVNKRRSVDFEVLKS